MPEKSIALKSDACRRVDAKLCSNMKLYAAGWYGESYACPVCGAKQDVEYASFSAPLIKDKAA